MGQRVKVEGSFKKNKIKSQIKNCCGPSQGPGSVSGKGVALIPNFISWAINPLFLRHNQCQKEDWEHEHTLKNHHLLWIPQRRKALKQISQRSGKIFCSYFEFFWLLNNPRRMMCTCARGCAGMWVLHTFLFPILTFLNNFSP